MVYQDDNFVIKYEERDQAYMPEVIAYLLEHYQGIMEFFKLSKLKKVVEINIIPTKQEIDELCATQIKKKPGAWFVGFANGNTINCLSLYDYKNTTHKFDDMNKAVEEYKKTIIHEFVHICHFQTIVTENLFLYLLEGIACCLSNQYIDHHDLVFTGELDKVMNVNKTINYKNAYLLVSYLIRNYPHEYVLKVLNDFNFAMEEIPRLYDEAKQYYSTNEIKR